MGLLIKNIFLLLISLFVFSTTNSTTEMPSCLRTTDVVVTPYAQTYTQDIEPINTLTAYQLSFFTQNYCNYQGSNTTFKQKNANRSHKHIHYLLNNNRFSIKIRKESPTISFHPLDYYIYTLEKIIT